MKTKLVDILAAATLALTCAHAEAGIYDVPDPRDRLIKEASLKLCRSTAEYLETLKFLRKTKDFTFHEDVSRKISEQVAKGCDGAAERFAKVIQLLKTVGFSERRSLEMALRFSTEAPETQKNFVEIFSKAYLSEFFDFEYPRAMQLALDLSRDYKGDPAVARQDFIELVKFCKDKSNLDLSLIFCADYSERIAKLSQYFTKGVHQPFLSLFKDLREKKEFSLDVKTALTYTHDILSHGPLASANFFEAFNLAVKDHELQKNAALEFALRMAARSHVDDRPPVIQFPPLLPNEEIAQKIAKP